MDLKKSKGEYRLPPFSSIKDIWVELENENKPYQLVPASEAQYLMEMKNRRESGRETSGRPLYFFIKDHLNIMVWPVPNQNGDARVRYMPPEAEF